MVIDEGFCASNPLVKASGCKKAPDIQEQITVHARHAFVRAAHRQMETSSQLPMMADATHHMGGGGLVIAPLEAAPPSEMSAGGQASSGPAQACGNRVEAEQFLTSNHSAMLRMRPFLLTFPAGECHRAQPRGNSQQPCCLHMMAQGRLIAETLPTVRCGSLYCSRVQRSNLSIRLSVSEPWMVPPQSPHPLAPI